MTRPLRIQYPGAIYHVTTRGNVGNDIFCDDGDYQLFISLIQEVAQRFNWICYAYCLMPNHYHLMVETPDANLAECMRHLNGIYTQQSNRQHERTGHVFQGRYRAILIEKQAYLLELCRYVVLNPVRAGLVRHCGDWRWSSYRKTIGKEPKPAFLASDWVLGNFGERTQEARRAYIAFVSEGLRSGSPWSGLKGGVLLGLPERLRGPQGGDCTGRIGSNRSLREVPRIQRTANRPPLGEILNMRVRGLQRDKTVFEAHGRWGYSMREIADFLGVHYATVSRAYHRHLRCAASG
jgi:REP element-mobilizing transposase RayT